MKKVMVVRVNEIEFELDDGRVYQHPIELKEIPTIEEFQDIYDHWKLVVNKELCNE